MEREICQVTIGAKTYEYPGGTSYLVIAREMQEHYWKMILDIKRIKGV